MNRTINRLIFSQNNSSEKIYKIDNDCSFESIAISAITSLYIASYSDYLESKKAMYDYQPFINTTIKLISKMESTFNSFQNNILKQISDRILSLQSNDIKPKIINIDNLYMALSSFGFNEFFVKFYHPFITTLNSMILKNIEYSYQSPSVASIFLFLFHNSKTLNMDIIPIEGSFNLINNENNYRNKKPLIDYMNSFILFKTKNIFIDIIKYFMLFNIGYYPDINNKIGITTITISDLLRESLFFNFNQKTILEGQQFKIFFKNNKIELNDIININNADLTMYRNFMIFFQTYIDNNNNKITNSLENLQIGLEATDDENTDDENTDDENTDDENTDDENTDDENTDDENTDDENTDDENTDDENTDDENTDEVKKVISPIGFKIELATKDETLEDFLFKKNAYEYLKTYLIDEKVSNIDKTLIKNIMNQWLFFLSVKTIKSILRNIKTLKLQQSI